MKDLPLATVGQRFAAALLDGFVRMAIIIFTFMAVKSGGNDTGNRFGLFFMGFFVAIIYTFIQDTFPLLNGQSIGKQVIGIKVVKKNTNESIINEYWTGVLRTIPRIIPFLNFIDIISLIADKERIGDRWADTKVIS